MADHGNDEMLFAESMIHDFSGNPLTRAAADHFVSQTTQIAFKPACLSLVEQVASSDKEIPSETNCKKNATEMNQDSERELCNRMKCIVPSEHDSNRYCSRPGGTWSLGQSRNQIAKN
jgi:hypothetical protein